MFISCNEDKIHEMEYKDKTEPVLKTKLDSFNYLKNEFEKLKNEPVNEGYMPGHKIPMH